MKFISISFFLFCLSYLKSINTLSKKHIILEENNAKHFQTLSTKTSQKPRSNIRSILKPKGIINFHFFFFLLTLELKSIDRFVKWASIRRPQLVYSSGEQEASTSYYYWCCSLGFPSVTQDRLLPSRITNRERNGSRMYVHLRTMHTWPMRACIALRRRRETWPTCAYTHVETQARGFTVKVSIFARNRSC